MKRLRPALQASGRSAWGRAPLPAKTSTRDPAGSRAAWLSSSEESVSLPVWRAPQAIHTGTLKL